MPHDRDAAATETRETHADQPQDTQPEMVADPPTDTGDDTATLKAKQQDHATTGASLQLVSRETFILGTFESLVVALGCPDGMQAISGAYDGLPDGWSASRSAPARDASGTPTGAWAFRFHGPAPGVPVAVTLMAFCTPASLSTTD